MLRISLLVLLAASSAALAQETAEPAAPAADSPAAATATPTATATATAAPPATKLVNPRLAPGGIAANSKGFPLHIQATLDTSLGNGVFAPGYQAQPSLGSSLNLRPSTSLPKLDGLPKMALSGSIDFSLANWIPSFGAGGGVYDRQLRVGDPSIALILPGLFTEEFTGITVALVASARAPLSIGSRQQNLITNAGASAQFSWSSPDLAIGSFFAQYSPSLRGSLYSQVGATMPCDAPNTDAVPRPLGNPINGVDTLPTFIGREEQILPDGTCILAGRQSLASIGNSIATGWTDTSGSHNVSLSLGISHSFVRGLKSDPSLSSPFSSGQNFNESTSGSLSYSYQLPVDFNASLSGGVFSGQPSVSGTGLRFPFWDFQTPANNFSGFFFDVVVGI